VAVAAVVLNVAIAVKSAAKPVAVPAATVT